MIRVTIVDDELPALKLAESVLKNLDDVSICGSFSDPDELLACLPTLEVDLLLVDMKMPGMHGLELAGRVQEQKPGVFIVFVTAYDDYAVEAFETEALDYIMKPITTERMQKTLDRYWKRCQVQKKEEVSEQIYVQCFGRFSMKKETGELMKFRTAKSEELFAFLLYQRGNPVSKDKIMEELWYDRDAERAQAMLYTTLYQLRKDLEAFGLYEIIQNSRKDGGQCWLSWLPARWDYAEYMDGYELIKEGSATINQIKRMVDLHKKGYLEENGYQWAEERKNELELSYIGLLEKLVDQEAQQQRLEHALLYLKRLVELSPYTEQIHSKIIALYFLMNQKETAISYYKNTKDMFWKELRVPYQIDIEAIARDPRKAFQSKDML